MTTPVYLVSNVHRSGSSMTMRCLKEGGLNVIYDGDSDEMNQTSSFDYIPNPNGFYQFNDIIDSNFYEQYKGSAIKCPIRELLKLPKGYYKLLFLKRDPKEIRMSMAKWTPYQSWGADEGLTYLYDSYISLLLGELAKRGDFEITVMEYAKIVKSPSTEFKKLKKTGWPIDYKKCASMVDPELHRFKLETDS
jgi:hypothetical protein